MATLMNNRLYREATVIALLTNECLVNQKVSNRGNQLLRRTTLGQVVNTEPARPVCGDDAVVCVVSRTYMQGWLMWRWFVSGSYQYLMSSIVQAASKEHVHTSYSVVLWHSRDRFACMRPNRRYRATDSVFFSSILGIMPLERETWRQFAGSQGSIIGVYFLLRYRCRHSFTRPF